MHRRYVVGLLLAIGLGVLFQSVSVSATAANSVVLSQIQLGTTTSASSEFIELYNNSSEDIELTDWCLYYASAATLTNGSKLACFTADSELIHLYLPTHTYSFAISTQLAALSPTLGSDLRFSATLAATAGHVRLVSNEGVVIDKVAWGASAVSPEGTAAGVPPSGKVLQRKGTQNIYQDTDVNSTDFESVIPRTSYSYGSIYEVQDLCSNMTGIQTVLPTGYSVDTHAVCSPPPVDVCTNIDDLQTVMPDGYALDSDGHCQQDVCGNIVGLQMSLPTGKEFDSARNCVDHDVCANVDDVQTSLPAGYRQDGDVCWLDLLPIRINEMLPNAIGTDSGHEFIELYNPNIVTVDLAQYRLQVGTSSLKMYTFPGGAFVPAGGYAVFTDDDIAFTLVNTTGHVTLVSADGQLVDDAPTYSDPYDGEAWELYSGTWQYSDQSTAGADNLPSLPPEIVEDGVSGLKPCAPNQYRNPETNRCRLIVTIGSTLAPCKDGQYRSEETNRCRSLGSDIASLVPCAEGQDRNPLTNRCRSSLLASAILTPCKEGQERNPDTNRCRNSAKISTADYAPQPVATSSDNGIGLIALATILAVALGYATWEWRAELTRLLARLRTFGRHAK